MAEQHEYRQRYRYVLAPAINASEGEEQVDLSQRYRYVLAPEGDASSSIWNMLVERLEAQGTPLQTFGQHCDCPVCNPQSGDDDFEKISCSFVRKRRRDYKLIHNFITSTNARNRARRAARSRTMTLEEAHIRLANSAVEIDTFGLPDAQIMELAMWDQDNELWEELEHNNMSTHTSQNNSYSASSQTELPAPVEMDLEEATNRLLDSD